MKIRWLGQGGFLIRSKDGRTEVLVDPYLSDIVRLAEGRPRQRPVPIKPADVKSDAVICTHDHLDHLDPGAIPEMPKNTFFVTTHDGCEHLDKLGQHNHKAVRAGDTMQIGGIHATFVYANHTSPEAFGVVLETDGVRLYISGDTLFDEKLFAISEHHPDITCICINGRLGNMNAEEAVVTAKKIGAKLNIPDHYDMFASNAADPKSFTKEFAASAAFAMEFNREYEVVRENGGISLK